MAARLKDKDIDFLEAFYQKPAKQKAAGGNGLMVFSLIASVLIVGLAYGYFQFRIFVYNSNLSVMQTYMEDPDVTQKYQQALDQQSKFTDAKIKEEALLKAKDALKSYPVLSGSNFQKFMACCGTNITLHGLTFDSSAATLTFTATADTADLFPEYIQRIQDSGIFSDVSYSGYKINANEKYDCAVTCTLKSEGQS